MSGAVDAYVALGANLGDRVANLRIAAERLAQLPETCLARSAIYETQPVGGPEDQPPYLNAAVHLRTQLSPHALLNRCLAIEHRMGRVRNMPNGPRIIDLDVLLHGRTVIATPELTVPHPRMHARGFVLLPLADIAPDVGHPLLERTIARLCTELPRVADACVATDLTWS
jgi:2-amino-4-hydroxy-6-hydroxymethyldihydropteridine diphosphokinase